LAITISEHASEERLKSNLADILEAVEPDIESLPQVWKDVFEGPQKLLIGSKISLGIIPEKRQFPIIQKADYIVSLIKSADFVNYDLSYISAEVTELFIIINTGMALNGKFLLEGPMSRQYIKQTQELTQPEERRRRR